MRRGSALGTVDFLFATRAEFIAAIEGGGIAALEVLARDLEGKLGLYAARSLSFEGIEYYEIVEHRLSAEQIRIYDAYAGAFQVIHRNLNEALKATNITGAGGESYNRNAKAAARSAFESNKQRFFNRSADGDEMPDCRPPRSNAISMRVMPPSSRSSRPMRRCSNAASPKSRPRNGLIRRHHAPGTACSTI